MYHHNPRPQTWCERCQATCHPAWQRIGDGEYELLCASCRRERDRQFTPEAAVIQAIIIMGIHIGRMNVERGQP